ncbi:unnamed protein product, partial [Notodromas monacha]
RVQFIWTSGRRQGNGWVWSGSGVRFPPRNQAAWSRTGGGGRPQPDNREGNEVCMAVLNNFYQDGIVWHDVGCSHQKPFICETRRAVEEFWSSLYDTHAETTREANASVLIWVLRIFPFINHDPTLTPGVVSWYGRSSGRRYDTHAETTREANASVLIWVLGIFPFINHDPTLTPGVVSWYGVDIEHLN